MNKTSPEIVNKAITLIAQGYSDTDIGKKCNINAVTVAGYRLSKSQDIIEIKKQILGKMAETSSDKLSALAVDMLKGSKLALDLILERIKEASPAQAAVILGILQDKYGMILGNPSANIRVQFQTRENMVDYIRSGIKPGIMELAQRPVVEVETIPTVPKPIAQVMLERGAANRAPAKRGRPRIHPLPDPNAPKRGRGRPRTISPLERVPINPIVPDIGIKGSQEAGK